VKGREWTRIGGPLVAKVGRFAPLLLVSVIILVACVSQKNSVTRSHQMNLDLHRRLVELREDVERARVEAARMASRERIELVASRDFGLRPPEPGDQVFLPDWRRAARPRTGVGSLAAGWFTTAGRGFGHLRAMLTGDDSRHRGAE